MRSSKAPLRAAVISAALSLAVPAGAQAQQRPDGDDAAGSGARSALRILERPTDRFRRSIDRWQDVREQRAPAASPQAYAAPESFGVSSATLEAIAACESGGDPSAVSADGSYRGKYQFDYGTWAAVGGSGDPAAAPEAEQDMRAAMLYAQSGSSPWPVCGV